MKITVLKEFENSTLAALYPVKAGKNYNSEDQDCPLTESQMRILLIMGVADDNDDRAQWKNTEWETKKYKKDSAIFKDGCAYVANTKTAKSWVRSEWDLVAGIEDYVSGISYLSNSQVYNDGHIHISNTDTSTTWVELEWDLKV